jgi:hypothetical protein
VVIYVSTGFEQVIIWLKICIFIQTQYKSLLSYIKFHNRAASINLFVTQALGKLKQYVCYLRDQLSCLTSCLSHKVLLSNVQHPGCRLPRLTKEMPVVFAGNQKLYFSLSGEWILIVSTCKVAVTLGYDATSLGIRFPTFRDKLVVFETWGFDHSVTPCHVVKDRKPQPHHYENLEP